MTRPAAPGADRPHRGDSAEPGQVTLFIIGFCVVLLTALAGVAAASSVYLTRRALTSVADGAAVAAADAVRESDVLDGTASGQRRLDSTAAGHAAAQAIALSGAGSSMTDFRWSGELAGNQREVLVTASATADIPLASSLFGRGVTVTVTARSAGRP